MSDHQKYATDPEYRKKRQAQIKAYAQSEKGKLAQQTKRANARLRNKAVLDNFKAGGCLLCKEKSLPAMDVHHVDPTEKEFDIGYIAGSTWAISKLLKELDKCVCLCANCHRKLHAGLITL